MPNGAILWVSG